MIRSFTIPCWLIFATHEKLIHEKNRKVLAFDLSPHVDLLRRPVNAPLHAATDAPVIPARAGIHRNALALLCLVNCVAGVRYAALAGGRGVRRAEGVYVDIMQPLDAEREARQRKKRRRNTSGK